jgi:hypothetical protein
MIPIPFRRLPGLSKRLLHINFRLWKPYKRPISLSALLPKKPVAKSIMEAFEENSGRVEEI